MVKVYDKERSIISDSSSNFMDIKSIMFVVKCNRKKELIEEIYDTLKNSTSDMLFKTDKNSDILKF